MYIFRPHRGTLDESMQESTIFEDKELMFEHIVKIHTDPVIGPAFSVDDLVLDSRVCSDNRIGWNDCRYVLVSRYGGDVFDHPQCIGYCATIFPKE